MIYVCNVNNNLLEITKNSHPMTIQRDLVVEAIIPCFFFCVFLQYALVLLLRMHL